MDSKVLALLTFFAGTLCGLGGYHFLGKGSGDDGEGGGSGSPAGVGSMLGDVAAEEGKNGAGGGGRGRRGVAMPDGFDDVSSISDIMAKAGPPGIGSRH